MNYNWPLSILIRNLVCFRFLVKLSFICKKIYNSQIIHSMSYCTSDKNTKHVSRGQQNFGGDKLNFLQWQHISNGWKKSEAIQPLQRVGEAGKYWVPRGDKTSNLPLISLFSATSQCYWSGTCTSEVVNKEVRRPNIISHLKRYTYRFLLRNSL